MVFGDNIQHKVAVLIPAYNCQELLDDTLRTLPQDFAVDVLIVDDGSDPPLVQSSFDTIHTVQFLRIEQNVGIHEALRRGVQALVSRGYQYAARLDAGDFALSRRFALQKQFLYDNPEIDLVGSAVKVNDQDGRVNCIRKFPSTDAECRRQILLRCVFSHPAVMFRLSAVMRAGNYRDTHPCAEDRDLFLRMMMNGKVANLSQALTRVVRPPDSITYLRRRRMIISTVRLQLAYFRLFYIEDWVGLLKSLLQLMVPRTVFEKLKIWLAHRPS
jgi:glycosyltransferase involved in cell wall biosynthesis